MFDILIIILVDASYHGLKHFLFFGTMILENGVDFVDSILLEISELFYHFVEILRFLNSLVTIIDIKNDLLLVPLETITSDQQLDIFDNLVSIPDILRVQHSSQLFLEIFYHFIRTVHH